MTRHPEGIDDQLDCIRREQFAHSQRGPLRAFLNQGPGRNDLSTGLRRAWNADRGYRLRKSEHHRDNALGNHPLPPFAQIARPALPRGGAAEEDGSRCRSPRARTDEAPPGGSGHRYRPRQYGGSLDTGWGR